MRDSTYHHGNLRRALLDAADSLLAEVGIQGFTLRACARYAGVSHAAPKHHFGDVSGLLGAVAERGFSRLADALTGALQACQGDLLEEMRATCRAYVGFAEVYPEHFRIMFRSDLISISTQDPPPGISRTFLELTNVILRQRGEPEVDMTAFSQTKSPDLASDILLGWCYIHGFAHLKLEGQLAMIPEDTHGAQLDLAAERLADLIRGNKLRTSTK